ncbi:ADOP family duplicated permease [Paludibaculum fermentans]|uniref:ABC transporter permease n=1 Tax=Paludibaculum fermentans TaxID=1473598 RepID=UPI003EB6A543
MSRWRHLWFRSRSEQQLEKELQFHMALYADELIAQGQEPGEARRLARLELGGPEQVKEACRDARGTRWVEDFVLDVRYAVRGLRRQPGFSTVALLTLALGIGAATVMFTIVHGVLLKPLAYPQADSLVSLHEQTEFSTRFGNQWAFAYPNFQDVQRASQSLQMAAWRFSGGTFGSRGDAEYVSARQISAGLFAVLRLPPALGREFESKDDQRGSAPVLILGQGFWHRRFAGNPGVLGTAILYEGKPHTVVGIAPGGFRLDDEEVEVFTPLGQNTEPVMTIRKAHPGINVVARLREGSSIAQARAELSLLGSQLARQYPDSNKGRSFVGAPLKPQVDDVRSTLWLLLGAAGILLLIACANVASLLLVRAVARERELAMRVALGAGRARLIRQCLTESAVLGLAGGLSGVVLAAFGVRPFLHFWPGSMPRVDEIRLDWRVVLVAVGVSLACGFLFGMLPALRAPVRGLDRTLRAGGRSMTGGSRRVHGSFVIVQLALAVVLLVSAGILGRTLLRLSALDPGLNIRNVLVTRMALSPTATTDPAKMRANWRDVLDRASQVPGVEAVSLVDTVPMREGNNQLGYSATPGVTAPNDQNIALATSVTPEYLKVMGIALRQGRFFTEQDQLTSAPVIVIDEVMSARAFPRQQAVGKHLWIPDMAEGALLVIGVVSHVRHWGPAIDDQAGVRAQFYYPFAQVPDRFVRRWSELMSVAVRTNRPPMSVVEPLTNAVRGSTGDQVLYEVRTMEQLAASMLGRQRFLVFLFGLFAGAALLLACIGIYGVMAYLTGRRIPEFGVRIAMGATAGDLMRLVLRQGLAMILGGVLLGLGAAWGAVRLLQHLVDGVQRAEPATLAAMTALLVAAAVLATYLPARRASRTDPVGALRQD